MNEQLLKLLEAIARDGWWVPLDCYVAAYHETKEAVWSRRRRGVWQDDVHLRELKGGGIWVNLLAVNRWAALGPVRERNESLLGSASGSRPRASRKASGSPSCSGTGSAASPSSD